MRLNSRLLNIVVLCCCLTFSASCDAAKKSAPVEPAKQATAPTPAGPGVKTAAELEAQCLADMKKVNGRDYEHMKSICKEMKQLDGCTSVSGTPIYHYDRLSDNKNGKRILTFALIHGDEGPSVSVARTWMERLSKIDPQNNWRIIPVLNPDGWAKNTRVNANKIDINRNFPTKNWKDDSQARWNHEGKDPRRFPGVDAGSEPETKCAMKHIAEFDPSFIISVHTPFGVLDFDGPRMKFPEYAELPWFSLGNFPGSMGLYMWVERKVPVLTIELKGNDSARRLEQFDRLQDVTGIVAIQSEKILRKDAKKKPKGDQADNESGVELETVARTKAKRLKSNI